MSKKKNFPKIVYVSRGDEDCLLVDESINLLDNGTFVGVYHLHETANVETRDPCLVDIKKAK